MRQRLTASQRSRFFIWAETATVFSGADSNQLHLTFRIDEPQAPNLRHIHQKKTVITLAGDHADYAESSDRCCDHCHRCHARTPMEWQLRYRSLEATGSSDPVDGPSSSPPHLLARSKNDCTELEKDPGYRDSVASVCDSVGPLVWCFHGAAVVLRTESEPQSWASRRRMISSLGCSQIQHDDPSFLLAGWNGH